MRRYWISPDQIRGNDVDISGESFHHIFDVCRQEVGSHFEVLGDGRSAHFVEVLKVEKKRALARILETRQIPPAKKPHWVLALSFCRYPVMDAVIEKAVEMGVTRIQPFYSEFSFIRNSSSLPPSKVERWQKIIISATQQSGRGDLMTISEPCSLKELWPQFNPSGSHQGLFAYEGSSTVATVGIREELQGSRQADSDAQKPKDLEEFWIFVGSEGGFSPTEVEVFREKGLKPVTLGEQVLRVETACIALLAVLKYEFGHMTAQVGDLD